jgi:predicted polyphosphate/ATP-dependent NAD kinase
VGLSPRLICFSIEIRFGKMKKIGFLINPIAGMGGTVGLKGTDGASTLKEAIRRGANPLSRDRAKKTLEVLVNSELDLLTCAKEMGGFALEEAGFSRYNVVYSPPDQTTAQDTKNACERFLDRGVDLILFCGGDGTARDIYTVVERRTPILGIPSGVKMHSAVFAINPEAASKIVLDFLQGKTSLGEAEIMDTDEEKYRQGKLDIKVFGYALTPYEPLLVQGSKSVFYSVTEEKSKEDIARFAIEFMRDDSLYILGPGTTIKKVSDLLDIDKTLLGVDVVKDQELIAKDVGEGELLKLLETEKKAKILVSPIGAQGFVFGRGNQQISPEVIEKVGVENIIILATPHKLKQTPALFVDTGDTELDRQLSGEVQVIVGYRLAQRKRIECVGK